MKNELFDAVLAEEDPMYDAAVIDKDGIQYYHNPLSNNCNNSHSVTKFFIAAGIGILCDKGLLNLSDRILTFFSEDELPEKYDEKWADVTVENAMQHKTGFEKIPYNIDSDNDLPQIGDDFLKYIVSLPLEHTPGSFYKYSDESYYLLSRVINRASGMSADTFLNENIFLPLGFRQWAMAKCPMGYPIAGGGFYARADDIAKLGFAYANGGIYDGKRIISESYISAAMERDYACTRFRDTDVFVKTGARGQIVAFSQERKTSCAWHGCADDSCARNDRLLEAFVRYLDCKENS